MIGLVKNVVATVAYYDVMDYPLTAFEVWKHFLALDADMIGERSDFGAVREALQMLVKEGRIGSDQGFYFLKGREMLVHRRLRQGKASVSRLKRVRSLVLWMRYLPFIRMIGVTGSLAMEESDTASDWDMLIVLRGGRIFTGRALVTGILHIFGRRRHHQKTKNRACLNYWITDESLEIGMKDAYSAHEYRFLLPFFGWDVYRKFEIANRWMVRFRPQFTFSEAPPLYLVPDSASSRFFRGCLEWLFDADMLERLLERFQKEKIHRNPLTMLEGSYIEASHSAMIFLPKPRGPKVFGLFREKLSQLKLS